MQIYKALKSKQSLGAAVLNKTAASLVNSKTPGKYRVAVFVDIVTAEHLCPTADTCCTCSSV